MSGINISYYSDVLCIWAYIAQKRLDKLAQEFGDKIVIESRFCSVFPDARGKIENKWGKEDGFARFNSHLIEVAREFDHIEINERLWLDTRPRTSASAHLFLKAIEIVEGDEGKTVPYPERLSTQAGWELRKAFFKSAHDISNWQVQCEIAETIGIDIRLLEKHIHSSQAFARLAADYDLAQKLQVAGSPTFIMNNGRQKLFGNVGYRLLEANVLELLRNTKRDDASWC